MPSPSSLAMNENQSEQVDVKAASGTTLIAEVSRLVDENEALKAQVGELLSQLAQHQNTEEVESEEHAAMEREINARDQQIQDLTGLLKESLRAFVAVLVKDNIELQESRDRVLRENCEMTQQLRDLKRQVAHLTPMEPVAMAAVEVRTAWKHGTSFEITKANQTLFNRLRDANLIKD